MAVPGLTVAALIQTRADPVIVKDALTRIRTRGRQLRVTDHKRAQDKHKATLNQIRIPTGVTRNGVRTTIKTQGARVPNDSLRSVSPKPVPMKERPRTRHRHKTRVTTGAQRDLWRLESRRNKERISKIRHAPNELLQLLIGQHQRSTELHPLSTELRLL